MHSALKLFSAGLLAGFVAFTTGCGSDDTGHPSGTLISISVQGEASQAPDTAHLSTGIVTEAANSNDAMRANAEQMDKLMQAIKKAGIPDKDVQTSGISLNPRYDYQPNREREIVGYQARNTVSITLRKLDELSNVIDTLAAEGANQLHGPSFSIAEPEPLLAEARNKALQQAQARAASYAESLGTKVRRIVSISEGGQGGMPRPMARMEMAAAQDGPSTPIARGESSVSVNLELLFELEK
ncbi:SIMPL domain-containing protein [Microbulbifer salipaludis]|uniref:SIMPL domain-containing protein n=1 Tax=Microbulbifer salipaludis TaxID=187980 RepID=A0ABS3E7C1_9GAMM|nr:SIMPL domain-containing protein [Microbulbifer salipaludis]MBN8431215.1 SIMPL domain-containing protein [Microbulbifer salipaludis]